MNRIFVFTSLVVLASSSSVGCRETTCERGQTGDDTFFESDAARIGVAWPGEGARNFATCSAFCSEMLTRGHYSGIDVHDVDVTYCGLTTLSEQTVVHCRGTRTECSSHTVGH